MTKEKSFETALEAAYGGGRPQIPPLSRERVFEETNGVLINVSRPSVFFESLSRSGILEELFPVVAAMRGVEQDPRFHPEGDVFIHTMNVLDCAAELRNRAENPVAFMYSALLHDTGKCVCTQHMENGRITAYGHEVLGDELIEKQIRMLTDDTALLNYVLNQTHLHMRPNMLFGAGSKRIKTRQLFDLSVCPNDLILLSRADASGKKDEPYNPAAEAWLRERLADYRERAAKPMVTRFELLNCGITDEADINALLRRARKLHFSGVDKKRALRQVLREFESAGTGECL